MFGKHSDEQVARFREREKQVSLAAVRGEQHVGGESAKQRQQRRAEKLAKKDAQRKQA